MNAPAHDCRKYNYCEYIFVDPGFFPVFSVCSHRFSDIRRLFGRSIVLVYCISFRLLGFRAVHCQLMDPSTSDKELENTQSKHKFVRHEYVSSTFVLFPPRTREITYHSH